MSDDPTTLRLPGEGLELAALAWGPPEGPLALCLHGFPDTAWSWRGVAPPLAAAGWRVIAPFLRGYAPSGLARDGRYDLFAYAADALAVRRSFGRRRAVLVGHDWGAVAAYAIAATEPDAFERIVTLAIPPLGLLAGPRLLRSAPVTVLGQLARSSYMAWNVLPGVAERSLPRLVPLLWRRWSPGYDATAELPRVLASLSTAPRRTAALRPYRAFLLPWVRRGRPLRPALGRPRVPLLALHGDEDGCMSVDLARRGAELLAPGRFAVIPGAGHFLALEQPSTVATQIRGFLQVDV